MIRLVPLALLSFVGACSGNGDPGTLPHDTSDSGSGLQTS